MVREVDAGGSQVAVARRHGVSQSWLGVQCRRVRREAPPRGALLPVRIAEPGQVRRIELRVGVSVIAFDEGTVPEYLAALVRSLGV